MNQFYTTVKTCYLLEYFTLVFELQGYILNCMYIWTLFYSL